MIWNLLMLSTSVDLKKILTLDEFFTLAVEAMDEAAFGYYRGGAADEYTLQDNAAAYQRIKLWPRFLVDVSVINTTTKINGKKIGLPLAVAPMAMLALAHDDREIGMAQASQDATIPMIVSTLSTTTIEDIVEHHDNLWYQLYVQKDRGVTADMVRRAEEAGFKALVLTIDLPVEGYREKYWRNPMKIPDHVELANLTGYWDRAKHATLMSYVHSEFDPSVTWDDLEQFIANTSLPVYVKGVLHPGDAEKAIDYGVQGIICSNHGGRQLDTTPATIDALPSIADAVQGDVEIIVDGGIRRGTDIVKALALGADAVLLGRPLAFALATAGRAGVERALQIVRAELENAMALTGKPTIADITRDVIFPAR